MKPTILIVNDDLRLCETRKMLLEGCGAEVETACGDPSLLARKLGRPLDLVLIDSTNVGFSRGEELCSIVKALDSTTCVAMLATPELGIAEVTSADRLILRTGPRQILRQVNELVHDRLDVNLWETSNTHGDQGPVV
jgi:CheY-like chemotaxis protein